MQRSLYLLCIPFLAISLSACGGHANVHVAAPPVSAAPEAPQLQAFEVIDSYGDSSRFVTPILDPVVDEGLFEIYWYADSFYDYWVTVSINDQPSMAGSIILSEELCGYNHSCDYDGMQWCTYDGDFFYMGCGADLYEMDRNMTDIVDLVWDLPEDLYLNIEVCDETGLLCEVSTRKVTLY